LILSLPPGTGSYSAWVALDISDDLQSWDEVAEAALSWLVNDQGTSVRLWAWLVGGVLALGAMAWHLFRQLERGAERPVA